MQHGQLNRGRKVMGFRGHFLFHFVAMCDLVHDMDTLFHLL